MRERLKNTIVILAVQTLPPKLNKCITDPYDNLEPVKPYFQNKK